jgi:hypothetical protein
MKRCLYLLWVPVAVLLLTTACSVVTTAGPSTSQTQTAPDGPTPPAQTLPADDAEFLDPPAGGLTAIANGGATVLDPAVAQLVGPTYGVAFEATGIAKSIDGPTYLKMSTGADNSSADGLGTRLPAPGYEFLVAMVVEQNLPEPTLGQPSAPFTSWVITVDDDQRQIRYHGARPELTAGEVIMVSVPIGHDAFLSATVDGQIGAISLRTGQLRVTM